MVALDNRTGQIRVLVGGQSFARSKFNRATQARRQVGSLFKPIVYATSLDQGLTAASTFMDEPVSYVAGPNQPPYQPLNYDRKFEGPGHPAPRARAVAEHSGGQGARGRGAGLPSWRWPSASA